MGPDANMGNCHEVTSRCPVEATVLGYRPNLTVNVVLAVVFCLCMIFNAATSSWSRAWGYSAFLVAGCSLEFAGRVILHHISSIPLSQFVREQLLLQITKAACLGYVARTQLSLNPWNGQAFQAQICAIILGPTLICISLYLTLKHITLAVDPSLSRLRPQLYPLVFIPADISCLILQAIGGRLAAGAGWENPTMLTSGNRLIIAGISLQCILLAIFGLLFLEFFHRVSRKVRAGKASPGTCRAWENRRFRWYCCALLGAYTAIFIRCVYRLVPSIPQWCSHDRCNLRFLVESPRWYTAGETKSCGTSRLLLRSKAGRCTLPSKTTNGSFCNLMRTIA